MDSLRKLVNFGKKLSILPFYTFFFKKDLLETETVIKFASQKEIILHFSIQILFIKFKSPRFVRIRAFFFAPKSSQQANKPTSQRTNEFSEIWWGRRVRLGPLWVCLGQKGPIEGAESRFNPLKTQLTPIFLTNIPPHPLSQILRKKITQIQPIQQTKLEMACHLLPPHWLANLLLVDLLTRWPVDFLKKSV